MKYANLTTDELLRVAYQEQDELTSTPLELELRKRLQDTHDELAESRELVEVWNEYEPGEPGALRDLLDRLPGADLSCAVALLSVLAEEDMVAADLLRAQLKRAQKLADLTDDPDAALNALETLFNIAS